MAAAVVGPPTFALLARIISSRLNLNTFPKSSDIARLITTIIATKANSSGAWEIIKEIEAGTPITTKNI